jgi:hypothetical protein
MNAGESRLPVPFRLSGILLIAGLCVESTGLRWIHPIAFLAYFVIGGVLLAAGVLLYFSSLILHHSPSNPNDTPSHYEAPPRS